MRFSTGSPQQLPSPTVVFAGVAVGDYRQRFLECARSFLPNLIVITGDVHFERSFKSGRELGMTVKRISNSFLARRRLVWQHKIIRPCVEADVCVIEHNPRSLTAWAVGCLRRITGKRTVAWGHVESRAGHRFTTGMARHAQRCLCGVALYYTDEERKTAEARYGRNPPAFVAPNSLYGLSEWSPPPSDAPRDFIVIGRLSLDKKPDVALRAFVASRLPFDCELHVVGDGPMRVELEEISQKSSRRVNFHGHVSDLKTLARLFQRSIAAISPGYVGLSIVQATYFGCPMIYSKDEPHAPEICLAREGFNAIAVECCDSNHFARAMERAVNIFGSSHRRFEIAKDSVTLFNTEAMTKGFVAAVLSCLGGKRCA